MVSVWQGRGGCVERERGADRVVDGSEESRGVSTGCKGGLGRFGAKAEGLDVLFLDLIERV